jgi:Cu-processing system permease protein
VNNALALAGVVVREMYRRKDFYVLFILTALLTLGMGSMNFFNEEKTVRALKEVCLLLVWISAMVMAITTAARQIPAEKENRTIFPLLAKPVSRAELIAGKFLGCWLACGLALLCFYVFFGLISAAREHTLPVASYFQALWLHWMMLGIVIAFALLGSLVFATPASNATICFVLAGAILFLGRDLNTIALKLSEPAGTLLYVVYYLLPHLEIFDVRDLIIHGQPPIPWGWWLLATPYAACYAAFFLTAAWLVFRRKPLN